MNIERLLSEAHMLDADAVVIDVAKAAPLRGIFCFGDSYRIFEFDEDPNEFFEPIMIGGAPLSSCAGEFTYEGRCYLWACDPLEWVDPGRNGLSFIFEKVSPLSAGENAGNGLLPSPPSCGQTAGAG